MGAGCHTRAPTGRSPLFEGVEGKNDESYSREDKRPAFT